MDLANKKVALLGFGVENQALLPYLRRAGAAVTVCDRNEALIEAPSGVATRLGPDYLTSLTDFAVVFRTPGLPYLTREIQEARLAGVLVSSQTKLFLELCPAKTIGVTGTKGKSTTASLIKVMLDAAKQRGEIKGEVYLAGNIGQPPVSLLGKLTPADWVILELSSFQLQDADRSPHIAVVLNVSLDHLDHHRDEAEYIAAKKNIVRYQTPSDWLVVNLDSMVSLLFANETPAKILFYSREKSVDVGCFVERRLDGDFLVWRPTAGAEAVITPVKAVKLVGAYNLENVTAAITAAGLAGAQSASLRQGATTFAGLPHRLQLVARLHNITYYDDSKATTPEATIAAVLCFSQPITLIVGGSSKGADYAELVNIVLASQVSQLLCIGREGERLAELFRQAGAGEKVVMGQSSMTAIVKQAQALTQPGAVVLLSPAAASFDMFDNAEDRGNQFQAAVKALA